MKKFSHVRNAIYGQPWAITPDYLNSICEIFERHVESGTTDFEAGMPMTPQGKQKYQVVSGVAVLPLSGPLFPKANLMTKLSGATSYQDFSLMFNDAMDRDDVANIIIHCDSPGGSCLGLTELANEIYESRTGSEKGIFALADGLCCSAAYMICSQADALFCTEGSMVGAIGTIARFDNYDRQERNEGNDSIVLRSSELKAAGTGPITPNQIQSLQKIVAAYFEQFKSSVARSRPEIDLEKAATGEVWIGDQAVSMALCDEVASLSELISDYQQKVWA